MKIQLTAKKGEVLYEQDQSEIFPDYRSVLLEAINTQADLTNLHVENQNLDGMEIVGLKDNNGVIFFECSLQGVKFQNCNNCCFYFYKCNLNGSKFSNCKLNSIYIDDSNLKKSIFKTVRCHNGFAIECDFSKCKFINSDFKEFAFHTSILTNAVFENTLLKDAHFVHTLPAKEWMSDVYFIDCRMDACNLLQLTDLSTLFILNSNIWDADLEHQEQFTTVVNQNSTVLYATESNVVWWQPGSSYNSDKRYIFRGTLEDLVYEVENDWPNSQVTHDVDVFVYWELKRVCKYLESWNKPLDEL